MGAGLRHHHVASAAGSFEGRELNAAAPQPPLAAKITGFTSLPRRARMTQRGCNVNRRWVSGHAILWRNWRQTSSILSPSCCIFSLIRTSENNPMNSLDTKTFAQKLEVGKTDYEERKFNLDLWLIRNDSKTLK